MKNTLKQRDGAGQRAWKGSGHFTAAFILTLAFLLASQPVFSQPIVDTVKAIQKQNDKAYRELSLLDPYGDSYTFTNVIKWHITDRELFDQIKEALQKDPFGVKPDEYRIDDIYLFCAPIGNDRVEPFHILLDGEILEKKKTKSKSGLGLFGDEEAGGTKAKRAFQGKTVVRLLHRSNTALLENINTIQGDNVEIPGEIVPHGSQLVKDTKMRYIFSKLFDQFYSKRAVLDEQRAFYGLPTSDEAFELPVDVNADSIKTPIDPESTTALPDDPNSIKGMRSDIRASRYERIFDISISDLRVNASKKLGVELELGNKEVGLPFWSSGVGRFWLNLKNQIGAESNVKLGLVFPLDLGNSDFLTFKARQLSGTFGGSVDAYFAGIDFFSGFNLPLAFKFSLMPPGQGSNSSIIYNGAATSAVALDGASIAIKPGQTFYREALIMQLYIPTIVQLNLNNFLQVSVGFGIDNVYQSMIPKGNGYDYTDPRKNGGHALFAADQADKIQDLAKVSNTVSPHMEIDYVNHQSSKFGLSAAYDHLFTFGGWIELIEDRLRIEMSYSAPIIRDAKPWEPSSFFLITPRFYF
ncbi:MAG: hypothetical protein Q8916_04635 [Bacteroidota bacterium]|nr:hypothetical protein [Bacteroidota bacterium]MDP4229674.1 hypothetical protein [Bacteroidota bacterium]MDP4237061.1 hypothetical protein [Bacteroidota bacterium]